MGKKKTNQGDYLIQTKMASAAVKQERTANKRMRQMTARESIIELVQVNIFPKELVDFEEKIKPT
jgi:hypothetical protein